MTGIGADIMYKTITINNLDRESNLNFKYINDLNLCGTTNFIVFNFVLYIAIFSYIRMSKTR